MKKILSIVPLGLMLIMAGCGGPEVKSEAEEQSIKIGTTTTKKETNTTTSTESNSPIIDLDNKGIGPIKSLPLEETIDETMAANGLDLFKTKCAACHKPDKKFIGPAPIGIFERRSPEWIMNMILDPEQMTKSDPIAKQLLIEYNGSPMANQGLTEEEARAILEYFRTL